jgi:hypothetical protein
MAGRGSPKALAIVLVVIELALAGGWWWLADYGLDNPDRVAPEFQAVVGQVMGGAMGLVAGIGIVLLFVTYRKARRP